MARSNRVLVVSPDPGLVNQVRGSLINIDIVDVSDIANAEEALERCENGGTRLIIAEVDLPGITGHELCRRLKETDNCPAVALIFRAGDDRAEEHCHRVGADATVGRPFQAQELADKLSHITKAASFNLPPAQEAEAAHGSGANGEEESVADESLYSDYEFGADESIDGVRSIDTGNIRPADTAEMEAVRQRGEFDEPEDISDLHADSSVKIASLHATDLDDSLTGDPFQPSQQIAGDGDAERPGEGGTLRDMVADHLSDLTSEGSQFRRELKALIRETVTEAVLTASSSDSGGSDAGGSDDFDNS